MDRLTNITENIIFPQTKYANVKNLILIWIYLVVPDLSIAFSRLSGGGTSAIIMMNVSLSIKVNSEMWKLKHKSMFTRTISVAYLRGH